MKPIAPSLLAAALAVLPLPARAETLGRITAYLGGESLTWHTIDVTLGARRMVTASFEQGARLTELRIQGHPEPRFTTRDVFSVDVRYLGAYAPGAVPLSVDVIHLPQGMGGPFWTSRGAGRPATVEVVELRVWGNYGRLVASFEAELCYRPMISAATDPQNCRPVTGVIETELVAE
ncbi:hypothetical protein [Vannielia litorea]|uniref:Uncharacterized protein n=1 Tax=Vannielia litorea TaxID=1217970 RepID=A0A1N6EHM9_9RHOB|nr:hypothetical protein [Vannielia litorea]SIN82534.1 hypothetical protein SAMN05444002_0796 [Vannielia litorea]